MGKEKFWANKKAAQWDPSSEPPPPTESNEKKSHNRNRSTKSGVKVGVENDMRLLRGPVIRTYTEENRGSTSEPPLFVYNYNPKNFNYSKDGIKISWGQIRNPKGNEVLEHVNQIINFAANKENYLKLRTDGPSLEDHIYKDHSISVSKINGGEHNGKLIVPDNLSPAETEEYKKALTNINAGYWNHIAELRKDEGRDSYLGTFREGRMDNLDITNLPNAEEATEKILEDLKGSMRDTLASQLEKNVVGLNANLDKENGNATLNSVYPKKASLYSK